MRGSIIPILLATVTACGQPPKDRESSAAALAEVETAAVAFLSYAHSFDYAALRASATPDFEILIFGQRLSLNGFIDVLSEMEASREGRPLNGYELESLNTEIRGDVAYTTWASPNWLESAIFVREDGRWQVDRAASVRRERGP